MLKAASRLAEGVQSTGQWQDGTAIPPVTPLHHETREPHKQRANDNTITER